MVDGDGMGRAFPELQMFIPYIYGCCPYPAGIADEKGNALAMAKVTSPLELEKYFRIVCVNMGYVRLASTPSPSRGVSYLKDGDGHYVFQG